MKLKRLTLAKLIFDGGHLVIGGAYMKRGSVWWVNLGEYSGHIQGGIRPAVVLGNLKGLKYGTTVTVIPVTSRIKRPDMRAHVLGFNRKLKKPCMALCEQITTVPRESILGYTPYISFNLPDIDAAVKEELGLEI